MNLTRPLPADPAQQIDRAALGDNPQPSVERTPRIVGLPGPMDSQKNLLDYVVDVVGRNALRGQRST